MSPERWIAVVGWDRLTHSDAVRGSGDTLPWHRSYASLLDDDGYWNLPAGTRGVYRDILLVALRSAGRVPEDTLTLTRKIGVKVSKRQLEALNHAGLIGFCASGAQADRLHAASPRAYREELERERARSSQSRAVVRPLTSDPDSDLDERDEEHKDEEPFAIGPEPELPRNGATADEHGPQPLEPDQLLERWKTA